MGFGPEDVQSNFETVVAGKDRLVHYLAVGSLLIIGCAVGWMFATLQMYSNWRRGIAPEANVYYAFAGVLFILLGGSGIIRSGWSMKRAISAGVLGLGLGAVVQYVQLGMAYIDFWW